MAESKNTVGTGFKVEKLLPKRKVTLLVWNWLAYKRSDVQETTVMCKKLQGDLNIIKGQQQTFFIASSKSCQLSTGRAKKMRAQQLLSFKPRRQTILHQHCIAESLALFYSSFIMLYTQECHYCRNTLIYCDIIFPLLPTHDWKQFESQVSWKLLKTEFVSQFITESVPVWCF